MFAGSNHRVKRIQLSHRSSCGIKPEPGRSSTRSVAGGAWQREATTASRSRCIRWAVIPCSGQSGAESDSIPGRDERERIRQTSISAQLGAWHSGCLVPPESTNPPNARRLAARARSLAQTRSVTMTVQAHSSEALRVQLAGSVLLPSDAAYEAARQVHNGLIDRRPAMVARCHGTPDVQAAVRFGREGSLELAVRGGGHNVAGNAVCDRGLLIDLSALRGVHVDPRTRRARAQGGATWGDYNRETQLHGLARTRGRVSSTGVG